MVECPGSSRRGRREIVADDTGGHLFVLLRPPPPRDTKWWFQRGRKVMRRQQQIIIRIKKETSEIMHTPMPHLHVGRRRCTTKRKASPPPSRFVDFLVTNDDKDDKMRNDYSGWRPEPTTLKELPPRCRGESNRVSKRNHTHENTGKPIGGFAETESNACGSTNHFLRERCREERETVIVEVVMTMTRRRRTQRFGS